MNCSQPSSKLIVEVDSYTNCFKACFMVLYVVNPPNFSGTFFMMCHKHQQCLVLGNTTVIAFFITLHWLVMMPSGALFPMHLNQHWKSHVKVDASFAESNPHSSRIEWPWWLTPTKGANDISYLLVRYVVSNDMTSPKSTNVALLLAYA